MRLPIPRPVEFLFLSFGALALPAQAADGRAVYETSCAVCHATGVADAPRFGDRGAWAPRLATGVPALVASVTRGKGAMPPKAGNAKLRGGDIRAAVEFMVAAAR